MKIIAALLAVLVSGSAFAANPYKVQNIMLLQPDFVLSERVEVRDLSNYIKAVNAAAETSLAAVTEPSPTSGFIVFAIRPGGQSKVWLDFSPALPASVATQLRSSLERVSPFEAKGGVVVFAINTTLWGAAATERDGPMPTEWQEALESKGGPTEIGDLVEQVWSSQDGT